MSTPESQQPKPGWEWYHPTTLEGGGGGGRGGERRGRGGEEGRQKGEKEVSLWFSSFSFFSLSPFSAFLGVALVPSPPRRRGLRREEKRRRKKGAKKDPRERVTPENRTRESNEKQRGTREEKNKTKT
jgi:hypothetical protein